MAAPEEGGTEAPPRPPPPAEGEPPGAACGATLGAAAAEESGGLPPPVELRAVPEELARSLAALEGGTVLYVQAEGAGPSAEEQPPSPSRHAATPLAPAELRRVIERVSRARELREAYRRSAATPWPVHSSCSVKQLNIHLFMSDVLSSGLKFHKLPN